MPRKLRNVQKQAAAMAPVSAPEIVDPWESYDPVQDAKDNGYMNPVMLAYFKYLADEEVRKTNRTILQAQEDLNDTNYTNVAEDAERAALISIADSKVIIINKNRKKLLSLDRALDQIDETLRLGVEKTEYPYGYSVISGEEIGAGRMKARCWATATFEEDQALAKKKKTHNPDAWASEKPDAYDL